MLNNLIGREIKIVNINDMRLNEYNEIITRIDSIVYNNIGYIFDVIDYDEQDKRIEIDVNGIKIWLYRNEYIFLIRNLIQ